MVVGGYCYRSKLCKTCGVFSISTLWAPHSMAIQRKGHIDVDK